MPALAPRADVTRSTSSPTSASTSARSLAAASAALSPSTIPAALVRISRSAQYVIPSP